MPFICDYCGGKHSFELTLKSDGECDVRMDRDYDTESRIIYNVLTYWRLVAEGKSTQNCMVSYHPETDDYTYFFKLYDSPEGDTSVSGRFKWSYGDVKITEETYHDY